LLRRALELMLAGSLRVPQSEFSRDGERALTEAPAKHEAALS